jgi:hypothetical protein
VNQPPQPQPTPQPQPMPPPAEPPPTIDGDYACVLCTIAMDSGGHNPFIRLCEAIVALFRALQGSITLSHPAPFVAISGDFNTTTGAFTATGRGTVAGFPNVSVRGDGTADARNGRITFDYTMGASGELPGGRPIVYRITLQRQR